MNGWIKIDRALAHHWLWQDSQRLKWWIDLQMMAAWCEQKQLAGRKLITLQRGQLVASLPFLSKRWKCNRKTVMAFLSLLQNENMIKKSTEYRITIITIIDYDGLSQNDEQLSYIEDITIEKTRQKRTQTDYSTDYSGDYSTDSSRDCSWDAIKEIKEKQEIKKISSSTTQVCVKETKILETLLGAAEWQQLLSHRLGMTASETLRWVEQFVLECRCRATEHRNTHDAMRHFVDWYRQQRAADEKREEQERRKRYAREREETYRKRRGTEIIDGSPEDYEGAF